MKILYIGRQVRNIDGGKIISMRNLQLLEMIPNSVITKIYFDYKNRYGLLFNLLLGKEYGFDQNVLNEIIQLLTFEKYDLIFIDHSILGWIVKYLKKYQVPIITFFHNVEYIYYKEKMKVQGIYNLPMVYFAKNNEKSALEDSNFIISLTARDSTLLKKVYNREADLILPSSFDDKFQITTQYIPYQNYHLFVGSAFFANIEGISWYIENVLDELNSQLLIIGKDMEFLRSKFNNKNFKVLGFVEDLTPYYNQAQFVINPVFSGSGMKTKTIEAMMYGKTIIGTKEAFIGIEQELSNIAIVCNNAQEFIVNINKNYRKFELYNEKARSLFLQEYNLSRTFELLKDFLKVRKVL